MDTRNLKVYLPFDTSPTEDLCGNVWSVESGSPTITDGEIYLDGSSYLKMAEDFVFSGQDLTVSFEVDFKVNPSSSNGNETCAWTFHYSTGYRIQLEFYSTGKIWLWGPNDKPSIEASLTLDNQKHHIEVGFSNSVWYLFVDGNLAGTHTYAWSSGSLPLYFGINKRGGNKIKGYFDNFIVYDGAILHTQSFTPPTDADYTALKKKLDLTTVTLSASTSRKLTNNYTISAPTSRRIAEQYIMFRYRLLREVVRSVQLEGNTSRKITNTVEIPANTLRKVVRSLVFSVPTLRKIAYELISFPAENFVVDTTVDKSEGLQSLSISIMEGQLTDQLSFTTTNSVDIMQQIIGQVFDYHFNLRVEQISQRGILSTCQCCSDIDHLLYTQRAYTLSKQTWNDGTYIKNTGEESSDTSKYHSYFTAGVFMIDKPAANSGAHISKIASILGKTPVLQFEDFVSSVDISQEGVTYQDLISEIFGWTSRIPHKRIHVFLRDDKLFVIQRGYEQNQIDISDFQISNLIVQKSLLRTSYGVTRTSESIERGGKQTHKKGYWEPVLGNELPPDDDDPGSDPLDDDDPFKEPKDLSQILPTHVRTEENGVVTDIYYEYDDDGNVTRTTTQTKSTVLGVIVASLVIVDNEYKNIEGKKYLSREHTAEYEWSPEEEDWIVVDNKVVIHEYTTVGQQHVSSVSEDGSINGSVTTPARHDDRPTPYDKRLAAYEPYEVEVDGSTFRSSRYPTYTYRDGKKIEVLGMIWRTDETVTDTTVTGTLETVKLYDSSFPVKGEAKLREITKEIQWLNRRVQETVSLEISNCPHIFDFNDRIILSGVQYFLQSNSFVQNQNIVNRQALQLVRWY